MKSFLKIEDGKINFSCKMGACKHSCCGPFSAITENLGNLDQRPFDEIVLTPKDYEKLVYEGFSDLIEEGFSKDMKKPYYRMALEADGTCKAFKNGKCAIQAYKPTLCRAFPFYFDMFTGLCAINCEGFDETHRTDLSALEPCLEAAREMYSYWIDFYTPEN